MVRSGSTVKERLIRTSKSFRSPVPEMRPPILSLDILSPTGRVLSIQSHPVKGYIGNKAAVFPLQLLEYDVDPINSLQCPSCDGYHGGHFMSAEQLWELVEGLDRKDLLHYTHLLTGRFDSVSFLNMVLKVVDKLRSVNPKLKYVCDPVMGGDGGLYVPREMVSLYREKVVPVASMLTPNQFEAELLTGLSIESERDARDACNILHAAGPSRVVITSIHLNGEMLLIGSHQKKEGQSPEQFKIVIPQIPATFTGVGDLTAALLLSWSHQYPKYLDTAARVTVTSLQSILQGTFDDYRSAGYDPESEDNQETHLEIRLIQNQQHIRNARLEMVEAEKYD